jgi:hypothetical protein
MRRTIIGAAAFAILAVASGYIARAQAPAQGRGGRGAAPQGAQPSAQPAQGRGTPARPQAVFPLESNYLDWRLLPSEQRFASIDGMKMLGWVKEQTAISDRYRQAGHPQFWGRIIGSSADRESAAWLIEKYKELGLQDIHEDLLDMPPQWFPQSWDLTATSGDKTLKLTAAQPTYTTPGTKGTIDLEVVYAGLGSEADLIGRDLRGKAVLIFSNPMPGSWRHTSTQESITTDEGQRATLLQLAERRGAAAIICSIQLPPVVGVGGDAGDGNIRTQLYPTGTNVPTFSLGMKDGKDLRDMIAHAPSGQPVHLKLNLAVQQVPNLKTSTVWGRLPGTTNETIYVEAHRDGWFEGATDNASGIATQLGLVEYFARVPQAQRRRTIIFLGTSGHHNSGGVNSAAWLSEHHEELFKNAALLINLEHTAAAGQELLGEAIRIVAGEAGFLWYGGGNQRPKLQEAAYKAFQEFGVPIYAEPEPGTPGGEASRLYPYVAAVQASNYNMFFHSDAETPAMVPAPGLAASARAYAKVIEEVNKMDLKDLQLPAPPAAAAPAGRGRQ